MSDSKAPLTDPKTGEPMRQRVQPGYYAGFTTLGQQQYWDEATRKVVLDRMGKPQQIRFFTPEEATTMQAVLDRILPQEDRLPGVRIPLLPPLDERLFTGRIDGYRYEGMPSDADAYRIAVRGFNAMAQETYNASFHELTVLSQERLLLSLHDGKPCGGREFWDQMNCARFWTMLVTDAASAYYAHPFAWDEVGFGGPAYPRGYMRLEEGKAEPWEVNEQRYEWVAPADTISDTDEAKGTSEAHQKHHAQAGTH